MSDTASVRYAVITGASSGFGREFALIAAREGFTPVLAARRKALLESLAVDLKVKHGVEAKVLALDLSIEESVQKLKVFCDELSAFPEVLVNNAGFGVFGPAIDLPAERIHRMTALNASAVAELSTFFARRMQASGAGRILNVASTAAFQPCPYLGVYGATKAFVLSFSEALAEELRGSGVTITALCPGPAKTNFGKAAGLKADSPFEKMAADARKVAEFGWRAMLLGKPVCVEGALNAFGAFIAQISPRGLARRIAGNLLARMK